MTQLWSRVAAGTTAILVACSLATLSAAAQEYCIRCQGPEAVYRCVLDVRTPPGMTLKQLCTTAMAREGGHARCEVAGGTVFDCNGPVRRVTGPSTGPPAAPTAPRDATPGKPSAPQSTLQPAPRAPEPPPPGQASADRSGQGQGNAPTPGSQPAEAPSRNAVERAGDAVGAASRKAWDCVTSLFKGC
jgi:hypothetical protein